MYYFMKICKSLQPVSVMGKFCGLCGYIGSINEKSAKNSNSRSKRLIAKVTFLITYD